MGSVKKLQAVAQAAENLRAALARALLEIERAQALVGGLRKEGMESLNLNAIGLLLMADLEIAKDFADFTGTEAHIAAKSGA